MLFQSDHLTRIVYFSRNRIILPEAAMSAEIDSILRISQANNGRDGVTGALIYNAGVFGQVLEGPVDAVEETFERIQMDDRHADVTLLEISSILERSFSNWSMGFVGAGGLPGAAGRGASTSGFDISRLSGPEIHGMLHSLMLKNEVRVEAA